jgi:ABC-type multidrug transport system permease subunit
MDRREEFDSAVIGMAVTALMAALVVGLFWLFTGFAFNEFGRWMAAVVLVGSLPIGAGLGVCEYLRDAEVERVQLREARLREVGR